MLERSVLLENCVRPSGFLMAANILLAAAPASAQTISVTSAPELNNVVSAPSGDTRFTISASTGAVTVTSGAGYRVRPGSTRAVVTVTCPNVGACDNKQVDVTVSAIGTPTNRAKALTNFTVASGTATVTPAGATGTNPITFKLEPIGRNGSKFFYLGMDFPIAGDSGGLATGTATSGFVVNASAASVNISDMGLARATVFRPIAIALTSNLSFGTITRTLSGTGSVMLDSATGNRTVTGYGVEARTPAIRASYLVSGEGGQILSVSVPPTFQMTQAGGASIVVTTNNNAVGTQALSGALGSGGTFSFSVGGSFPLTSTMALGSYSGTFTVSAQYN